MTAVQICMTGKMLIQLWDMNVLSGALGAPSMERSAIKCHMTTVEVHIVQQKTPKQVPACIHGVRMSLILLMLNLYNCKL